MVEQYTTDELKDMLRKRGIQPSFHRIQVFKYLLENRIHPTVDNIYRTLNKEIPTLSKTTIYNTLNLFAEKGLVEILTIDEREARYDIETSPHGHFKCVKCGAIYDVWDVKVGFDKKQLKGFDIGSVHVYIRGVCKNCQKSS